MDQCERFPIMGDPEITWVPWRMIAPHEAQARKNHGQSLKRLAERGGLSVCECLNVLEGREWTPMSAHTARHDLMAWVEVHIETAT